MKHPILSTRWPIVLLLASLLLAALLPSPAPQAQPQPFQVLRIRVADDRAAQRLAQQVDLLETRDGDDLFALAGATELAQLQAEGWAVQVDAEQTALLQTANVARFDPAYRTVPQIETDLAALALTYPTLAQLRSYGMSFERQADPYVGHDLLMLRLRSQHHPGPLPVLTVIAALHARELTTSEIALRFAEELLAGYGREPWATWLLDEHEVVVIPVANPDGRRLAEQGWLQRKNRNPGTFQCVWPPQLGNQAGVDLNRNFAHRWGWIDSPMTRTPCQETYPGLAADSEPETAALRDLLRQLYPSRRPPTPENPLLPATSGLILSLHSYGQLVLWPWGYSREAAPNGVELARLGAQMAKASDATAVQAIGLYPTSGTLEDWAYGELGVPAYTFEIGGTGGTCGGFTPPFACLDGLAAQGGALAERWLAAVHHGAAVSRAPLSLPAGPSAEAVEAYFTDETLVIQARFVETAPPQRVVVGLGASQVYTETVALTVAASDPQLWQVAIPRPLEWPTYLVIQAETGAGWGLPTVTAGQWRTYLPLAR